MNIWKRALMMLLAAAMLVTMPMAASAIQGFENESCLIVAAEPKKTSEFVHYFKNGEEKPLDTMTWVDGGVHGKALSLNGKDEYLQIGYEQLRMAQMTFSTWINFRGSVDEAKPAAALWQRLFTIHAGESCYFTVSPHAQDTTVTNTDGQLDGVYMEYYRGDEEENYSMKSFTGAIAGKSNFGLPQNEWHHMAIVVDTMSVKLYVDGNLIMEELFLMPIVQMSADVMLIGGGMWGDPLLNALLDDTLLFERALTAQEIAALMQTGDLAALKNPAAATTAASHYEPTTVITTTASTTPTEQPADKPYAPFGLPVWGFGVCVGLLALLILLTVVVNVYEAQRLKPKTVTVEEEPEPEISSIFDEPEQGEERFLTRAELEREKRAAQSEGGADE